MKTTTRIALAVVLAIGLVFAAATIVTAVPTVRFVAAATRTSAIYAGSAAHTGGSHGGVFLYPRFRFVTPDGQSHTMEARSGSTDQPFADGQAVAVLYDPRDPADARVDTFFTLWTDALFLAAFALPLTVVPLVLFVRLRRR